MESILQRESLVPERWPIIKLSQQLIVRTLSFRSLTGSMLGGMDSSIDGKTAQGEVT